MPGPALRLNLGRAMTAVAVVGVLLALLRAAVVSHPHVRKCWELAAHEERLGQSCLLAASEYESCAQEVPCSPSEYCWNACLAHVGRQPAPSPEQRERAAEEHRQAAGDFREAAGRHALMARRYRQAAFRWSSPLPNAPTTAQAGAVFNRYRCDSF